MPCENCGANLGENHNFCPRCGQPVQSGRGSGSITVGRLDDNDIVIRESNVSRHHARINWVEGVFQIEDLNSANGTYVNGYQVNIAQISNRDRITLGKHVPLSFSEILQAAERKGGLRRQVPPSPGPGWQPAPGPAPSPDPGWQPAPNPARRPMPEPGWQPAPNPARRPAPGPGGQAEPQPRRRQAPNPGPAAPNRAWGSGGDEITVNQWLGYLILTGIPIVGFFVAIAWSKDQNRPSRANWARLIMYVNLLTSIIMIVSLAYTFYMMHSLSSALSSLTAL